MASNPLRDLWSGLELRSQITLIGGVIAVLGTLYVLYGYASKQSYSALATGLAPTETGQAEQTLAGAGIAYRVATGGTEIDVPAGEVSQARIALAEKGVLGDNSSQNGFSVFNKTSLGTTDFQQQVQYQQALQTEIAQTIDQIQGVNSSNVELVLPDDSLFATQTSKATAAVLVNGGSSLDAPTIQGIAHLVASSVKGLNVGDVTITDETGALLWPGASSGGAGAGGAGSKLQADDLYSSQLSAQVNALLTSTLGPNKAMARVQADLNANETTLEKVSYAKKGVPLTKQTQNESLNSTGGGAALPAGTAANVTATAGTTGSGANSSSKYKNSTATTSYGVAKTIQRSVVAPGTVNQLNVALMVDTSVPATVVASLQKSVASLVGLNKKRGDTMAVTRIAFAKPKVAKVAPASPMAMLGNPISLAKDVAAGLAALIFLFLMRRSLKKREGEASVPAPTWLRELQGGITVAELEGGPLQLPPAKQQDPVRDQIEQIANNAPEAIATQVSSWMRE